MNLFLKCLKFYVNSSIHVALAVVSLTCITYLDFDLKIEQNLLSFVFFSTILAYTFVKYISLVKHKHLKLARSLKLIIILSLFSILPIFISLVHFETKVLIFITLLGLFTLLYVLPFLPKAKNLRDISGLKIFIIALVWTGTTVMLPFLTSEFDLRSFYPEFILYAVSRFFIVIALIIPFEIRDLKLDDIYLKTLPQVLGVFRSKVLAVVLILCSMVLLYFSQIDTYIYVYIYLLLILLVIYSKRESGFYYSALLVEGVPILWFLLKYLMS